MDMGRAIDEFLTSWLPGLSAISEVNREFIYWVVPISAGLLWGLFKWIAPTVKRTSNWWWIRRELKKPREHELGYHDHRGRLKKLWVRLSYLRRDVYALLAAAGQLTDGVAGKKDAAPAHFWSGLAARMDPKVGKLETVAAEMNEL